MGSIRRSPLRISRLLLHRRPLTSAPLPFGRGFALAHFTASGTTAARLNQDPNGRAPMDTQAEAKPTSFKIVGPQEGDFYWQPVPANGFIRNILSQATTGSDANFSI